MPTVTWLVLIRCVQGNRDLPCGVLNTLDSYEHEGQFTLNIFFDLCLSKH